MPRKARGPYLKYLEKRGVYFILWSRGDSRQGMLSTGTADPAEAEAALRKFLAEEYHQRATKERPSEGKDYVYFIGGDVGAIKIGRSRRPEERLASLQCGSPIPLRILAVAPGSPNLEWYYHTVQFHKFRLHGEWFERSPEVLAEIDRLGCVRA